MMTGSIYVCFRVMRSHCRCIFGYLFHSFSLLRVYPFRFWPPEPRTAELLLSNKQPRLSPGLLRFWLPLLEGLLTGFWRGS